MIQDTDNEVFYSIVSVWEIAIKHNSLLLSGKLNSYLADMNEQAEELFLRLVEELAEKENIMETLKAENQMLWVQRMNAVREMATEIVNHDLTYA